MLKININSKLITNEEKLNNFVNGKIFTCSGICIPFGIKNIRNRSIGQSYWDADYYDCDIICYNDDNTIDNVWEDGRIQIYEDDKVCRITQKTNDNNSYRIVFDEEYKK